METSNQIATIEVSTALTWTTKSGKGKAAASQTLRATAPLAVRRAEGARNDLFMLQRGVYRHMNTDIIAAKTGKDYQALDLMGYASLPQNADKKQAREYFGAIAKLWGGMKGNKGSLAATCAMFCAWVDAKPESAAPLVIENETAAD